MLKFILWDRHPVANPLLKMILCFRRGSPCGYPLWLPIFFYDTDFTGCHVSYGRHHGRHYGRYFGQPQGIAPTDEKKDLQTQEHYQKSDSKPDWSIFQ